MAWPGVEPANDAYYALETSTAYPHLSDLLFLLDVMVETTLSMVQPKKYP